MKIEGSELEEVLAQTGKIGGGFSLVLFRSESKSPLSSVASWMRKRLEENQRLNIETDVFVLQDILPRSSMRKASRINPGLVDFFIFSQSPVSDEEFTSLKYGEIEIGKMITEISGKREATERKGEIILIDLSILINTFGIHRAYNLLLNKMDTLRKSGISLVAVIHEKIHDEQDIALFKAIADNITVI